MTSPLSDLELALQIADVADVISMQKYRSLDLVIETKPDASPVTEADKAVEVAIREALKAGRPNDLIVGEEFGGDGDLAAGRRWIVDPIDGTKNYLRGVPVWATLIALVENEKVLLGVVSAPAMNRRWWGSVEGAFTKDADGSVRSIRVSEVSDISNASFSYSDAIGWDRHPNGVEGFNWLRDNTWRSRGYGDFLSHMFVAEGAVDVAAEPILEPWDVAALIGVVEAAGGKLTGYDGDFAIRARAGLTTNGKLHAEVLALFH